MSWINLFDETLKTRIITGYEPSPYAALTMAYPGFSAGDVIRLTINGESRELTAVYQKEDTSQNANVYVGNSEVGGGASNGFENENVIDYDFCLLQYLVMPPDALFTPGASAYLHTKEAGTYAVKIEKLTADSLDPTALLMGYRVGSSI